MTTSSNKAEKINLLSKGLALVGATIFAFGIVWPMLATGASQWSPEQQAELHIGLTRSPHFG